MESVEQHYMVQVNIHELLYLRLREKARMIRYFAEDEDICSLRSPDGLMLYLPQDEAADVIKKYPGGDWQPLWARLHKAAKKCKVPRPNYLRSPEVTVSLSF